MQLLILRIPNSTDIFLTGNFISTSSPECYQPNKISMASVCAILGCSAIGKESAMNQTSSATPTEKYAIPNMGYLPAGLCSN